MSLAQHYGLPTRLLDWTLSPLVAAYFATDPDEKDDAIFGSIRVLNPIRLNELVKEGPGLLCFTTGNQAVSELVTPAFDDAVAEVRKIVAVLPAEHDLRLFVQQSVFTLHGCALDLDDWLTESIPDERELSHFRLFAVIPPGTKRALRADLDRLGINEATLFPDLSNLARYVARDPRNRKKSVPPH